MSFLYFFTFKKDVWLIYCQSQYWTAIQLHCHIHNKTLIPADAHTKPDFDNTGPTLLYCTKKIRFMYSQKWNCAALFPIPMFMYLWVIYILPGSVCLTGCSKIGRQILRIYKSLTDTWMWKLGGRTLWFCFGNNEVPKFHFWESEPNICNRF